MGNQRVYQTAVSDFHNFGSFEKREKIINKKVLKKNQRRFSKFEFSKERYMCERTLCGIYVYTISNKYLKNDRVLIF